MNTQDVGEPEFRSEQFPADGGKSAIDEYKDRYLRVLADQDNYRKRLQRVFDERAEEVKRRYLLKLIAIGDNLQRALQYADPQNPVVEGLRLTYRQFEDTLAAEGVEVMQTEGKPFDPQLHEAVAVDNGPGPNNVVTAELLKGYTYQGQVLRPAHVHVRKNA